jgi:hypothetical protein
MAYTEKQRKIRRCKVIKRDGSQCRSYSKIDGDGRCALHLYDHKTKVLPKANEREATRIRRAKNVKPQKRATCTCSAYPFIHRLSSGFCAHPDPPRFRLVKPFGKKTSSPRHRAEQDASSAGGRSHGEHSFQWDEEWAATPTAERGGAVSRIEDSGSVQYGEDSLPDLDAEQVPQDREERAAWNARKLKRLIEQEMPKQVADDLWHY